MCFDRYVNNLPSEKMAQKIFRPMLTYSDEAHHSSAGTYQKILDYFTPKFVLGMTATPDKREENTDLNVYEIYN